MFRFCCLVLLAVFSVIADPNHEPESGFGYKYSQRQGRRDNAEEDNTHVVDNRYFTHQNSQKETAVYRPPQNVAEVISKNLDKIQINSEHQQEDEDEEIDEEENSQNIPYNNVRETQEENGPVMKFTPQQQQEVEKVLNEISQNKQILNQGATADSRRFEVGPNYPMAAQQSGDSMTNSASAYSTMVLHDDPEQQISSLIPQFKSLRGKPTKVYAKPNRPNLRESPINYTPLRNIQQEDPPPQHFQQIPVTPTPGDPFVHSVHPSIMKSLLKQQPQTFDLPQKDSEDFENPTNTWNAHSDSKSPNSEQNYNSYKAVSQQDSNADMDKRPIYVPNRVSIQNPSSDSSFNVGYSIGFGGSGLTQHPKMGIVQPPVNFRQGKEVSYPSSYQNTPVNVHFDGKDTIWKNMGNGVEMSHSMDSKLKEYNDVSSNYQNEHSSGRVINQPLFHRETYDEKFSGPTAGRNSFDHNHALQQSNTFDFSNAIDPITNLPYSTEQKSSFFSSPAYKETFLKQAIPSYIESFPKQYQSSFTEVSSKHVRPYVESTQYLNPNPTTPQHSQTSVSTGGRVNYEGGNYERPPHSETSSGLIKTISAIPVSHKAKAIDFSKTNLKPSYTFKPNGGSTLNHFGEDLYGHNVGFSGMPVVPSMYSPAGKPPSGMVQAFLVPVNTAAQSFPYPVGMPIMGHGYSPYFGQPIGVIRMPEHLASPYRSGYEHPEVVANSPSETQQYTPSYQGPPPMKVVHSHYSAVKHQKELATESSPYHLQRAPHPAHRDEEAGDHRHPMKFKRLYTTESPEHAHSLMKTQTPSSHSSPEMPEATTPPYTYHPRPYRKGSMIIVKRA